ncbi:MAG TPA: nucleotide-diphospho-sugar transferase [Catalimonadaceae bacterium]|nr:nucleotide-diphospho-sugar transferase [Catalimonadaceae bacterium]
MDQKPFSIPVLLITFNRPDVTEVVLNRILEINPPKLYFFNDAPRTGNENDSLKCSQVRALADKLNYSGKLLTRFEEKNLGCKMGESTAMSWLFENEEMGIVLEDDTLPNKDFFFYCEHMLNAYKDDSRIFSISGCNLVNEWKSEIQDYHFSHFGSFWAWAGWKRSWKHYDVKMSLWHDPKIRQLILNYIPTEEYKELRATEFDSLVSGYNDTWDFQWWFAHYLNHSLSIVPSKNLVRNIGINRPDAVHMTEDSPFSDLVDSPIRFPIQYNPVVVPDFDYDISVVRKGYPYFYEKPVYPEPPKPTFPQKFRMGIGALIGSKGPVRSLVNLLMGRK